MTSPAPRVTMSYGEFTVMTVLVTAASRHGATQEIAEAIANGLTERGVDASAMPVENVANPGDYDAYVIGSAVYMGRWLKPAREFVQANTDTLREAPVWLFSSGPLGPPEHR